MTEDALWLDRTVSRDVRGVAAASPPYADEADSRPTDDKRLVVELDLASGGRRDAGEAARPCLLSNMASLSDTLPACFFRTGRSRFTLPFDFFSSSSRIQARRLPMTPPRPATLRAAAGAAACDGTPPPSVKLEVDEEAADVGAEVTDFCQVCIRSSGVADALLDDDDDVDCAVLVLAVTLLSDGVAPAYME